ncbi:MAG: histidine kinase [Crocinitomicaceae bacterium]|nr:histidine kinase [Crocinitomicaceae bacterium]
MNLTAQDTPIRLEVFSKDYSIFQWTTENGLSQNNIKEIIEGPNGYLWLATFNGLIRFDGYEFKIFNEGNTPEMNSSVILSIVKDKNEQIWFSTTTEIIQLNNHELIQHELLSPGFNKLNILNGDLYVTTPDKLFKYDNKQSSFIYEIVLNNGVNLFDVDDEIYFHQNGKIMLLQDGKAKTLAKISRPCRLFGDIFISKSDSTLKFHQVNSKTNRVISINELPLLRDAINDDDNLEMIKYSPYGDLHAIITDEKIILSSSKKILLELSNSSYSAKSIKDVHFSDNGMIWVGTSDQGLILLYPKKFKSLLSEFPEISQAGNFIYEAPDATIWTDLFCGSMMQINPKNNQTKIINTNTICPWGMLIDQNKKTWIIDVHNGLYHYDSTLHKVPGKILATTNVFYSIYETKKGHKYIGTNTGIYKVVNDSIQFISNTAGLEHVYVFYEDRQDNLLFCSKSGLGFLEENDDFVIIDKGSGLPTNDVRSVYQDANLNYWIGTSMHGLYLYDNQNFYALPYYDKRLGQDVLCIIEDDLGNLWMNSNNGIYRANRSELINYAYSPTHTFSTMRFTSADGLHSSEGNSRTQNKAFMGNDGNLWFSMITGPVYINPKEIGTLNEKRKIQIDEVKIDKRIVEFDSIIVVEPEQNIIQLKFSHPNFNRSEHVLYAYRIEELNDDWIEIDRNRVITLTELPFGKYTLTIKQVGTNNKVKAKLNIKAYFWEKDFFKFIVVFISTGFFFLVIFYVLKVRKRGRIKLKVMSNDLNNLKLKALQTQMNPHFIFNCLNSIQSLYILDQHDKANLYMTRFSRLLRIILEHAQKPLISLEEEVEMFNIYVPLESLQFEDEFDYNITIDPSIDMINTQIPSMVTQTFIENSIKHGLKTLKGRRGKLEINILKYKQSILIEVIDNGVGYKQAHRLKKELEVSHQSRGTEITKQRIELINTLNEINIQIQTTHLKNKEGKSIGTKVGLYFPKTIM